MNNDIRKIARVTRGALFGVRGVTGVLDDLKAEWDAAIVSFQTRRMELDQAESDLYAIWPDVQDDADAAEWRSLFARVNAAKSTMDAMAGAVSTVAEWWYSFTGAVGLSGVRSRGVAGNLGIVIPAFPLTIGALTGIIATVATIVASVSAFITYVIVKRDRAQQLIDAGVDPVKAVETATAEAIARSGVSFGANIERVAMWGAVIALIVFIAPGLLGKRK